MHRESASELRSKLGVPLAAKNHVHRQTDHKASMDACVAPSGPQIESMALAFTLGPPGLHLHFGIRIGQRAGSVL